MENLVLPGLVLVVYIAFIFPQLKKRRDQRNLLASLTEGDEVITSSGLHGIISALDESVVYIEVSEGVEVKFTRSSVATKLSNDPDSDS
jgi:preprotein translocase subunit YajC